MFRKIPLNEEVHESKGTYKRWFMITKMGFMFAMIQRFELSSVDG